ncbi:MAG TPA: hypothetical protein VMS93_11830, partial [Candidatus Saccharimonadales bacterium]|nr:hypothetical protein [Candidatus Saccharimonadales bacterium]
MFEPLEPGRPPSAISVGILGAAHLARLRLHERWSAARVRQHEDELLRRLITHAAAHVPYYRDLFRTLGLRPSDIRTREDLARLPILPRSQLQHRPETLVSDRAPRRRLTRCQSSGSTGERIVMWLDPNEYIESWGFWAYAFLRCGGRPTDRYAVLAFRHSTPPSRRPFFEKLGLFRVSTLYAEEAQEQTLARLEELRPDVLYGHPSVLHLLALCALRRGTRFRPRLVLTHGEVLMPETRALLKESLGWDVRNTYGAAEA